MPCEVIAPGIIVCSKGRRRRCSTCGELGATKLCDGPAPAGAPRKTCDRALCPRCAHHVEGKDLDFCQEHRPEDPMRGGPPQHVAQILAIARRNAGIDEPQQLANQEGESHDPGAGKAGAPPEPAGESPSSPAAAPSPFAPHTPADVAHPVPAHPPKICRSCSAEIMWTQSESTGRAMPVDYAPTEKGNVALWDRKGSIISRVLAGEDLVEARRAGRPLRMPHHATCPQGKSWRTK